MRRSKTTALIGVLVLLATSTAGGVCGLMLCGGQTAPAGCHSTTEPGGARLTDCCAAHSPDGAQEMALDALSLARVATLIESPEVAAPDLALPTSFELLPDRRAAVALFTLHRSLLL